MMNEPNRASSKPASPDGNPASPDGPLGSPIEQLFENFPRGLAVIELEDPDDVSSWRLAGINSHASTLVAPSIQAFLDAETLHLSSPIDLPGFYRDIISTRRSRTLGTIQARGPGVHNQWSYILSAFPVGLRGVGILFEDVQALVSGHGARALLEYQLAQTCEFVGAILWRADPETLQFTYVSRNAETILGYWPERWKGETNFWKKHLFPDDRERVAGICEKIFRERRRRDFEFRMMSVQGQVLWFHAAAEIAEQPGRRPELTGVMNDITELKRAEERIRALSSRLVRLQDDERRHISRELHDSLGQYLTSIKINVELVKRESTSIEERHRALLAESAETLERCVREVRSVSYLLHPPLLDELGLVAALRWYTAGFAERSGIDVNLDVPRGFSRLAGEMELTLFRIVQESLTNVQRHAGSDTVRVTLSEHADGAEVRIADTGVGVPAEIVEQIKEGKAIKGVGLRGMYERVRELGGRFKIESSGMGTTVFAVLALQHAVKRETEQESDDHKRAAGKPLEATDLRIEGPGGKNGVGGATGPESRASGPAPLNRRHASRGSR
jgi:PAS domain S-box-containing protein